jgi:hypothetical protein
MTAIAAYVQQTAATTYFATRLYATGWTAATSGDKDSALIMATITIDSLPYKGQKVTPGARPAFPRYIPLARGGYYLVEDDDDLLAAACCEEALELVVNGASKRSVLQNQGVTSFTIDNLSEAFTSRSEVPRLTSMRARLLLHQYLAHGVPIV